MCDSIAFFASQIVLNKQSFLNNLLFFGNVNSTFMAYTL